MTKPQLSLEEVQNLHKEGKLKEAKQGYLAILSVYPNEIAALHMLGILCAEEGELEEAEAYLQQAIAINSHDPALPLHLANIYKARGLLGEAQQMLEELTQTYPQFAAAFNNLGIIYFNQKKWTQAIETYQAAIAIQPNYVDAYYNLGLALNKAGRRQEALNTYKAVLDLSAQHAGAHFQLGSLLMLLDKHEEASQHFILLLKSHPFHFETHTNLASCYLHLGRFLEAKTHYLQALEIMPHDNQVIFNLAVISLRQGLLDEAVTFYTQAVKNDADFYDAHNNLGFIFLIKKETSAALHHFKEALRIQPNNEAIRHTIHILQGEKSISSSPPDYIRSLFDSYADHFDAHLLQGLHYQIPQVFFKLWQKHNDKRDKRLDILDLGCGTGLCGDFFEPLAKTLVGVDLSEKMLMEAAKKNKYDELIAADIVVFLEHKKEQYDLILAGDVLVYFGDMTAVFPAVTAALRPNGFFLFDLEIGEKDDYSLTDSGRFAHSKTYVDGLIAKNKLTLIDYQTPVIRTQNERAVKGHLYLVQKQM